VVNCACGQKRKHPNALEKLNMKIEFINKLHDQQIMNWLEDECGVETVTAYGEALPEHVYPDDKELIRDVLNRVLEDCGSSLRLLECIGQDDDGYIWRVKDA
jgi:hypothetical protein